MKTVPGIYYCSLKIDTSNIYICFCLTQSKSLIVARIRNWIYLKKSVWIQIRKKSFWI